MKLIKAFLDSSVIIAGLVSESGGSHKILILAESGVIIPLISELVVREVLGNAEKKMPDRYNLFYSLFKNMPFKLINPAKDDLIRAKALINEKDAPVLAAALTGRADWLISLDKHFLTFKAPPELATGTPGDFIQRVFP